MTNRYYVPPALPAPIKTYGYHRARPCPRCGGKDLRLDRKENRYYCNLCHLMGPKEPTILLAKISWNKLPRRK